MTTFRQLLLAGGAALAAAGSATAETYRYSTWGQESEPMVAASRQFAEDIAEATGGEISFEFHSGAVIMPPNSHLQGIGDGVAHGGQVTTGYTPSAFPLNTAIIGFGFIESDPTTIGAAYADWIMHDPAALEEFERHNVIPLGAFSTGTYHFLCNTPEPITELEQVRGIKFRTYGLTGELITYLGGVPVNIASSEAYQALQGGQTDCAVFFAGFLTDQKLLEVTKSMTMTHLSPAFNPQITLNKDFWQGLTEEQRATIIELAARTQARAQIMYNVQDAEAIAEVRAVPGYQVVEPAESLASAMERWVEDGVGDMAGVAKNTLGVADPEALFASFAPYVEKWQGLVGGMTDRNDEEELTRLYLDHLFNDLDPATYGMN